MQPGTRTKYVDMCGRIVEGAVVGVVGTWHDTVLLAGVSGESSKSTVSAALNNMAAASSKSTVLLADASSKSPVSLAPAVDIMAAASSKCPVSLAPASNNMAIESIKSTRTKHRTFTYFIRHDNGTSGEIRSDCPYLFSADDVIPESILTEHIDGEDC